MYTVVGKKKFGKWIDFGHKDATDELKFVGLSLVNHVQIHLTFLLSNIPAIWYIVSRTSIFQKYGVIQMLIN